MFNVKKIIGGFMKEEFKKQLDEKRIKLHKILKEQDERKDLNYKIDEERKLIREIMYLDNKIMEVK